MVSAPGCACYLIDGEHVVRAEVIDACPMHGHPPLAPREVLVFGVGRDVLVLSDYPWLVATRVILKGSEADGGEGGYALVELYDRKIAQ